MLFDVLWLLALVFVPIIYSAWVEHEPRDQKPQ
jgi:hypothetical protein